MNPEVFIDTGKEIRPGDIVICHAPRSTPTLYRTKDDIRVYWVQGRIVDYHPRCLPDGTIVMYLSTEMVAGYTWAKVLYKDSTFYVSTKFKENQGWQTDRWGTPL